jgi:hypothetical protein
MVTLKILFIVLHYAQNKQTNMMDMVSLTLHLMIKETPPPSLTHLILKAECLHKENIDQ